MEFDENLYAENNGHKLFCPQLPGTLLRVFVPPGIEINVLNLVEISLPSGICLQVRLPFLLEEPLARTATSELKSVVETVKAVVNEVNK